VIAAATTANSSIEFSIEAFVCHIGFIADGMPFVVPTNYVRVGDQLFLHGSVASRLMKTLGSGAPFVLVLRCSTASYVPATAQAIPSTTAPSS